MLDPFLVSGVVAAGLVSILSPLVIRPILARRGVVDVPNERSSHVSVTVRGGGIGVMAAFIVGGLIAPMGSQTSAVGVCLVIVVAAGTMAAVGLIEDLRGLAVGVRASLQLLIGVLGSWAAWSIQPSIGAWIIPLGGLMFALYVNVTNFMDGINGISGMHGLVVGGTFAAIGVHESLSWLVAMGGVLAVSFGFFLWWNLRPPGYFLGDVGSYLLGGAVAAIATGAALGGVPPLAIVGPCIIYLTDSLTTILGRAIRREPVFKPHRLHTYQRLSDQHGHVRTATLVSALSVLTATICWMGAFGYVPLATAVGLTAVIALTYMALPALTRAFQRDRTSL